MAQHGFVYKKGDSWFLKYRDNVSENGQIVRKQQCVKLAALGDRYRTESDVRKAGLVDDVLLPINTGRLNPESTLTIKEYGENSWLPWVRDNSKPSTIAGYETRWNRYVAPRVAKIALRDFRTVDAANLLSEIHREYNLSRSGLQHCRSLLSGIFALARNQGVLDKPNPCEGVMIPRKASPPKEMHATSAEEVLAILNALETVKILDNKGREVEVDPAFRLKAQAAVALMFFAGLRPGEARGLEWSDFDGQRLVVRQSVWHTHATAPKTAGSIKPVPVIEPLRALLEELRQADGNPSSGPILRGPSAGRPIILDNLAKRVVAPLLAAAKLEWHGWYSLRRGVATTLRGLTHDSLAAKGLLRHSNVSTTERHYIKDVPENTLKAMNLLELMFNDCSTTEAGKEN
jgi:integrase